MTDKNGSLYEFGGFVLDTRQNILLRGGEQAKLPAKAFELLQFFVKNSNQVIDKETLMSEVWKDSFVEDANLAVHISNLRKIFETDKIQSVTIETFPKVGYRFNADVNVVANGHVRTVRVALRSPNTRGRQPMVQRKMGRKKYPSQQNQAR